MNLSQAELQAMGDGAPHQLLKRMDALFDLKVPEVRIREVYQGGFGKTAEERKAAAELEAEVQYLAKGLPLAVKEELQAFEDRSLRPCEECELRGAGCVGCCLRGRVSRG